MAIKPVCDVAACGKELVVFGAILFSPPDEKGLVKKQHVCADCYEDMQRHLFTEGLRQALWRNPQGDRFK